MDIIEVVVGPAGEISSPWWSGEIKKLFCNICGKCNGENMSCMVVNPLCG